MRSIRDKSVGHLATLSWLAQVDRLYLCTLLETATEQSLMWDSGGARGEQSPRAHTFQIFAARV